MQTIEYLEALAHTPHYNLDTKKLSNSNFDLSKLNSANNASIRNVFGESAYVANPTDVVKL